MRPPRRFGVKFPAVADAVSSFEVFEDVELRVPYPLLAAAELLVVAIAPISPSVAGKVGKTLTKPAFYEAGFEVTFWSELLFLLTLFSSFLLFPPDNLALTWSSSESAILSCSEIFPLFETGPVVS